MSTDYAPLPTIAEAQAAHSLINQGRTAIGLDPVEFLEYDAATPYYGANCLSARNVFTAAGFHVGTEDVYPRPNTQHKKQELIDAGLIDGEHTIAAAIRKLTDPFDNIANAEDSEAASAALRERLVEAGVVAP